jgi:hypothetical protein
VRNSQIVLLAMSDRGPATVYDIAAALPGLTFENVKNAFSSLTTTKAIKTTGRLRPYPDEHQRKKMNRHKGVAEYTLTQSGKDLVASLRSVRVNA